ncbi:MAG: hypothetical protein ACT4P5_02255 [Armatimonadota bacterium]
MPDAIPDTIRIFVAQIVPPAYPATPKPTRVSLEDRAWVDTRVEFDSIYTQAWLVASNRRPRMFRLQYEKQPGDALDVVMNYYRVQSGMAGIFPFVHPVTSESLNARFAKEVLVWQLHPKADVYTWEVDLEEVFL